MEITEFALCILITLLPILALITRYQEKKNFNNGYCKECNTRLRLFDMDSQGGRGYICDKCGYHVWVSYKVDKNFEW